MISLGRASHTRGAGRPTLTHLVNTGPREVEESERETGVGGVEEEGRGGRGYLKTRGATGKADDQQTQDLRCVQSWSKVGGTSCRCSGVTFQELRG